MKDLKILFITFEFPPYSFSGGGGIYASNLIREMSNKGIQIHVIFPIYKHDSNHIPKKIDGKIYLHPIILRRIPGLEYVQFNVKVYKYIKRLYKKFDLVHFNFQPLFKVGYIPNIISVLHPIGSLKLILKYIPNLIFSPRFLLEYNPILVKIDQLSLKRSDKIIAISKFSKNWLINHYHINSNKIKEIYLGVDLIDPEISSIEKIREKYDLIGKKVILFVGRLEYRKGIWDLIKAISNIKKINNIKCIIIGRGPLKNILLDYISNIGVKNRFRFVDMVSFQTLSCLYHLCDIYVQPSFLEGFGLTVIEAMNAKKTVITTNVGSLPELITNNFNGILIPPNRPDLLMKKIIYCLENEDFTKEMGENAYHTVKEKFNWSKTADKTIDIYKKVIN
ncbi:MAG: glycosyltransferase family 4 protein [Candidatus Helarchaeota archaeon]